MELTWREFSVQHNGTLKDFISRNETRLNKLQEDARIAQVRRHLFSHITIDSKSEVFDVQNCLTIVKMAAIGLLADTVQPPLSYLHHKI